MDSRIPYQPPTIHKNVAARLEIYFTAGGLGFKVEGGFGAPSLHARAGSSQGTPDFFRDCRGTRGCELS